MPRKKWSNITNVDKKTIKDLKEKDVICLPSDKGTEFCIIQKDRYSQAALDHLNDSNTAIESSLVTILERERLKDLEASLGSTGETRLILVERC